MQLLRVRYIKIKPNYCTNFNQFLHRTNLQATQQIINGDYLGGLNAFNWSRSDLRQGLEDSVLHNDIYAYCGSEDVSKTGLKHTIHVKMSCIAGELLWVLRFKNSPAISH